MWIGEYQERPVTQWNTLAQLSCHPYYRCRKGRLLVKDNGKPSFLFIPSTQLWTINLAVLTHSISCSCLNCENKISMKEIVKKTWSNDVKCEGSMVHSPPAFVEKDFWKSVSNLCLCQQPAPCIGPGPINQSYGKYMKIGPAPGKVKSEQQLSLVYASHSFGSLKLIWIDMAWSN